MPCPGFPHSQERSDSASRQFTGLTVSVELSRPELHIARVSDNAVTDVRTAEMEPGILMS
jgi:hypothetical protein